MILWYIISLSLSLSLSLSNYNFIHFWIILYQTLKIIIKKLELLLNLLLNIIIFYIL